MSFSPKARKAAPPATAVNPAAKRINLTIDHETPDFRWQMFFNAFSVERLDNGALLKVAHVTNNTAPEIVPIFVSREGIEHFRESATEYIQSFGATEPYSGPGLPSTRTFSPLFSNFIRVAHSGQSAEFSFFTVPLRVIAEVAKKGSIDGSIKIKCVQVALLHSDLKLHHQVVVALIAAL